MPPIWSRRPIASTTGVHFYGIGGTHMREAGVDVQVDARELAVVGLVEVLAHYRVIKAALERMRGQLREDPPDLLVLTDYPDFNLRLAKTAHECGVKVLYYISPQVWAWRQGRVKQIRERVDMMAVVFAFEEEFYRRHDVPVRFVGHPLVDEVAAEDPRPLPALREALGLDAARPVVGLFPGSRRGGDPAPAARAAGGRHASAAAQIPACSSSCPSPPRSARTILPRR